jgi:hypothetical protein
MKKLQQAMGSGLGKDGERNHRLMETVLSNSCAALRANLQSWIFRGSSTKVEEHHQFEENGLRNPSLRNPDYRKLA